MKKDINRMIERAEELGWTVTDEGDSQYTDGDNQYMFSKHSPEGQDFSITVEGDNAEDIVDNIYEAYMDFDVSYETYMWLDDTGHGKNGSPYDMRDLYDDMEACEQMILDLYGELKELDFDED